VQSSPCTTLVKVSNERPDCLPCRVVTCCAAPAQSPYFTKGVSYPACLRNERFLAYAGQRYANAFAPPRGKTTKGILTGALPELRVGYIRVNRDWRTGKLVVVPAQFITNLLRDFFRRHQMIERSIFAVAPHQRYDRLQLRLFAGCTQARNTHHMLAGRI
jgi:hypothetical protein